MHQPLHGLLKQRFGPRRPAAAAFAARCTLAATFFQAPRSLTLMASSVFQKLSEFVCHLLSALPITGPLFSFSNRCPTAVAPLYASSRTIFPLSRAGVKATPAMVNGDIHHETLQQAVGPLQEFDGVATEGVAAPVFLAQPADELAEDLAAAPEFAG